MGWAAMLLPNCVISHLSRQKIQQQHHYYVLKISVNGASTTSGLVLWKILVLCGGIKP
jgi:hypothetical protein